MADERKRKGEGWTYIRVHRDLLPKLNELKARFSLSSYDGVIRELIRRVEDPKSAVDALSYWLLDLRADVKEIARSLSEFVELVRELRRR